VASSSVIRDTPQPESSMTLALAVRPLLSRVATKVLGKDGSGRLGWSVGGAGGVVTDSVLAEGLASLSLWSMV